jgi:hypothetical protein
MRNSVAPGCLPGKNNDAQWIDKIRTLATLLSSLSPKPVRCDRFDELNTGDRGVIVAANRADTSRPILKITSSRTGAIQPHGPIISLANYARRSGALSALSIPAKNGRCTSVPQIGARGCGVIRDGLPYPFKHTTERRGC